jgi:hypothetical protein
MKLEMNIDEQWQGKVYLGDLYLQGKLYWVLQKQDIRL